MFNPFPQNHSSSRKKYQPITIIKKNNIDK